MIARLTLVSLAVLSLAACTRPPGDPLSYTGISAATNTTIASRTITSPNDADVSAIRDEADDHITKLTFSDGPLAGRSFDVENDAIVGGLEAGETAFLEQIGISGGIYPTILVGVQGTGTAATYALYSPSAAAMRPWTGTASFVGVAVANGYSPTGTGLADGTFSIFANFTASKIIGTISGLTFRSGGSFPTIRFTADYESSRGSRFFADTLTIDGTPVNSYHLEGSTHAVVTDATPRGDTNGAFSVDGGTADPSTAYGLTGVFDSQLQSYTP